MDDVVMPRLSDSMEEGTIIRWLKADGDEVRRGDELLEIETDKATMTYEADVSGTLSISASEGDTVPVGAVIGSLGKPDTAPTPRETAASPAHDEAAEPAASAASGNTTSSPPGGTAVRAVPAGASAQAEKGVNASPVARRAAARLGVDLMLLAGSGPSGRVLKADVVAAAKTPLAVTPAPTPSQPAQPAQPAVPAATEPEPANGGERNPLESLTRTQSVIAQRMAESRATVPDFSLDVDVDMSAALQLRAQLKAIADPAPSINDLVVKVCAVALGRHPRANGSYRDGQFELHPAINVGVAVAAPDALVVPVIHNADEKSLGTIAMETRRLAARVRSREITPSELSGGTFTVSNLGMYGIDRFEAIINVPQAAILCVGALRERPVAVEGEVVVRPMMSLTLACDHRILYGADAAELLADVRRFLEQPLAVAL